MTGTGVKRTRWLSLTAQHVVFRGYLLAFILGGFFQYVSRARFWLYDAEWGLSLLCQCVYNCGIAAGEGRLIHT